ncbi:hypothetical protein I2I05_18910 [Hymenobacter sp. BT683]|uniref:Uncharacterized protein n=1 Tax=Hymenobacter jeongseonensis TaxID=2791027 RepID=A0ABS0IMC2_9BACT|nr:hypothetical protein [Hymenobacter jeongseonensis]MBF9239471.1 hypothetical protein [Hymenobacter jeongseonensis]
MEGKFAHILGFLGLKGNTDTVTEAHLQAADDKIALLEQEKSAAELKATQAAAAQVAAQTALDTAKTDLATASTKLSAEQEKVTTLENWKKEQKATDGREEDNSNDLDGDHDGPQASWEVAAASQIAGVKKRLGEK